MSSNQRKIVDPKAIRAMAHPLRWQILDLLRSRGALTATEVSEEVGESPANCSFHLRTLAKYGFIEEADGGTGRSRPWKAVDVAWSTTEGESEIPDHTVRALNRIVRERAFRAIEAWDEVKSRYSLRWRRNAFQIEYGLPLTAAELVEIRDGIKELIEPYVERERREGAIGVNLYAWGIPTGDPDSATAKKAAKKAAGKATKKSAS